MQYFDPASKGTFFYFFFVVSPSGLPLFDHLRSIFHHLIFLILTILVDGATRRRLIRTSSCSSNRNSNRSTPQKKTNFLYQSSSGFEPTTFLIHDLESWRSRPLDHRRPTVKEHFKISYVNCTITLPINKCIFSDAINSWLFYCVL